MPSSIVGTEGQDGVQVLDDFFLKGGRNLRLGFVTNSILSGHHIVGGMDEWNGQWSECRRSLVGQLFSVLDEVFRKDPMSEGTGHQIEDGQRSFLSMRGSFCWGLQVRFWLESSEDGLGREGTRQ